MNEQDRAWKEIDLDALAHNTRVIRALLPPGCELMAVVKADAYGHGAVPVARRLEMEGVRSFAVACLSEGIALRQADIQGDILMSLPYGFMLAPDRHIIVDPKKANVVRTIYQQYLSGVSLGGIADFLFGHGIPSPKEKGRWT